MHVEAASRSLASESALGTAIPEFETKLKDLGLTQTAVFASLWDSGPNDADEAEGFADEGRPEGWRSEDHRHEGCCGQAQEGRMETEGHVQAQKRSSGGVGHQRATID